MKNLKFLLILVLTIFIVSGCSKTTNNTNNQNNNDKQTQNKTIDETLKAQTNIKKFKSIEELTAFLEDNELDSNSRGYNAPMMAGRGMEVNESLSFSDSVESAPMAMGKSIVSSQSAGSSDFSTTNIQVEGVDEADIIKSDGKYIYALVKNELNIINAYPAKTAKILSKIKFKDRPQNIYINGDRLVVYGQDYSWRNKELYNSFIRRNSFTFLKVFDISDRENPKQLKDLNFEGNFSDSRMIGDYVYLVTNNYNYYYIDNEPMLPRIIDGDTVVASSCQDANCFNPDIYYFDIPYSSYNITSVSAINIKDLDAPIKGDVYLLDSGQNMYVSPSNIFLTYTKYISEYQLIMEVSKELIYPRLNTKDQEKIAKIEEVETFILSKNEKENKINQIVQRFMANKPPDEQESLQKELETAIKKKYQDISKELEKTIIHKIAINKGDIDYQGNGEVVGHVLNQFSMDESADGYFRIATTKNRTWSRFLEDEEKKSYNNLYILDKDLKTVGTLEGLAKGEQIKSVRFMQNRAYMVTFEQIDPLFVIDLQNPNNPKVLGELKIPGYSDYLYPYNDHILIGLGKDAFQNEYNRTTTGGVKLSMFDVNDVANPREIDSYIMGDSGSNSIALQDHKAFYLETDKNILAIPVTLRKKTGEKYYNSSISFSGAMVFDIDETGFKLKGKIDHSNGGQTANRDYWGGYNYYDNNVKRILHIDDTLYTFSNMSLKMNTIDDLQEINNLKFSKEPSDIEIINKNNPRDFDIEPMSAPISMDDIYEGSTSNSSDEPDEEMEDVEIKRTY